MLHLTVTYYPDHHRRSVVGAAVLRPEEVSLTMGKPRIRCAIYTRKSSDEGLDQGFNSLDAQFEACVAYIASQRHEGWVACRARYDDGGISGGVRLRSPLRSSSWPISTQVSCRWWLFKKSAA